MNDLKPSPPMAARQAGPVARATSPRDQPDRAAPTTTPPVQAYEVSAAGLAGWEVFRGYF